MTPEHLKKSIFTYAFSGMLVEQKDNEYVNEEGFKAVKDIPDDIDIPETWRWTYLPDIATICYGFPFNSEFFNETKKGRPLIRIRDIIGGKTSTYTTEDCPDEYVIKKGDMLVGMDGNFQVEYWGSEEALLNQRVCKIDANNDYLDQDYLYYYLPIILKEINGSVSFSTVKHLSAKILNAMLIPLPPIEEQHRIVAKIEEMLPYVDRYAEAYEKLGQLNAKFPEDMKKSILQYAIQGKLVEQRPEEGTAEELYQQIQDEKQKLVKEGKVKKEKPLAEITEDEIPFDIPESWKWVRLGTVTEMLSGYAFKSSEFKKIGKYKLLRGINLGVTGVRWDDTVYIDDIDSSMDRYLLIKDDIILGMDRPWISDGIRTTIFNGENNTLLVQRVLRIRNTKAIICKYTEVLLKTNMFRNSVEAETTGISVPHISQKQVEDFIIPLPPIEEQKRIIRKVEELLPFCDQLIK